jgi:hypothetical protein
MPSSTRTLDLGVWHAGLPGPTLALLEWKRREFGVSSEVARTLPLMRNAQRSILSGLYADAGLGARWELAYEAGAWWSDESPHAWRIGYTSLDFSPRIHLMSRLPVLGDRWALGLGVVLTTGMEMGFASARDEFRCEDNSTERGAAMLLAEQAEENGEEPPEVPELEVTCQEAFSERSVTGPYWTGIQMHPTLRLSRPPDFVDDVRFRPDTVSLGLRQVPYIGYWYYIQVTWFLSKKVGGPRS